MPSNDAAPLQLIAHGECSAANPSVMSNQVGVLPFGTGSSAFTNPGVYAIEIDPALPGGGALSAAALRVLVQVNTANISAQVVKTAGPPTLFTVNTFTTAAGNAATNAAFDFWVWRFQGV